MSERHPALLTDEEVQRVLAHVAITTKDTAPEVRHGGQAIHAPFAICDPTLLAQRLSDLAALKLVTYIDTEILTHRLADSSRGVQWRMVLRDKWDEFQGVIEAGCRKSEVRP